MLDILQNYYDWLKAFHIVFMTCWVSGMFYITRLFAWHSQVEVETDTHLALVSLEKKALRFIINPTMILAITLGLCLANIYGWQALGLSFYVKMVCVLLMVLIHMFIAKSRRRFEYGTNKISRASFQQLSYTIVIIFVIIVIMAAVKPLSD